MTADDPPRSVHLPIGYDEDDPYEGEDTTTYPEWWQRNIEVFRLHGLRPYRPPQFIDGAYTTHVIGDLEEKYELAIDLRSYNPHKGNSRELIVDGESIATIEHEREAEGYTEYKISSDEFEQLVRSSIESKSDEQRQ